MTFKSYLALFIFCSLSLVLISCNDANPANSLPEKSESAKNSEKAESAKKFNEKVYALLVKSTVLNAMKQCQKKNLSETECGKLKTDEIEKGRLENLKTVEEVAKEINGICDISPKELCNAHRESFLRKAEKAFFN
jgi:hypothetical protein